MLLFFISIIGYAIACTAPPMICKSMPIGELSILVLAGTAELVYEIAGVIKIYKARTGPDDEDK